MPVNRKLGLTQTVTVGNLAVIMRVARHTRGNACTRAARDFAICERG